ncbi:MAG: NAD-dependent epimerase/dehydratase family protein [Dehalococcoidia bacterium]
MEVQVTGGTGYVGSHTVAELVHGGHDVKLLVRDPSRIRPALEPLGVGEVESVTGDVTDKGSVEQALDGCDSVIHCASVYSLDPRAAGRIKKTNVDGTELVIGAAHERGLDPIVHVSSFVVLIGERGKVLTPDSLPTEPKAVYPRSKADSDRVARQHQEKGAPVVITYPGMVWGPYDPHLGDTCQTAKSILRRAWTFIPMGGVPPSDVRDVAKPHAAVLEKDRGPRRYISPSQNVPVKDMMWTVSRVTGRWLSTIALPGWMLSWPKRMVDAIQLISPVRMPFNFQAVYIAVLNHKVAASLTRTEFGMEPDPVEQSIADTIRWMYESNHLSRSVAGRLAT